MQLPLLNLSLFSLLLCIHSTFALYDICYFQNMTETCTIGDFDPPLYNIPNNICSVESCPDNDDCLMCSDCDVVNWVTFAQYKGLLYHTSHFFSKALETPGSDAAYNCTRQQTEPRRRDTDTCNCPETQPCDGDEFFCHRVSVCNKNSTCYCSTRFVTLSSYLQISPSFGLDNPLLVSFKACIYRNPVNLVPSRKLLSVNTAEFQNTFAAISFHDPVFTFNTSGTFIARKDGLEIVHTISEDARQFVLPLSYRYTAGTLTFTFVNPDGHILSGSVQIPSSTHCSRISCTFCTEMLTNLPCLPPTIQYFIYGFFVVTSGLILIYVRSACGALASLFRTFLWILLSIFRLFRTCFRIALRTGALTGASTRRQLERTYSKLSEFSDSPVTPKKKPSPQSSVLSQKYSIVLLACFIPLLLASPANQECNELKIITSRVSACETLPSGQKSCSLSGQAQLTLSNIGSTTCLFFSDDSGSNIYHVRVTFEDVTCQWTTIHQYYTFPVSVHISSKLVCPNFEYCSWGAKCVPRREYFPEITKESRAWPGVTSCISVPAKTRFCGVIHYDPCLHFRWYLLPQYNATYRVDKITGHTCRPIITISEAINNRLVNISTSDHVTTKSGIALNILGTYDQPLSLPSPYFVQNIHDFSDSHLESASPNSQPVPGQLGDIQAPSPLSTNFIFSPLMVDCNTYETTLHCHLPQSYISVLQTQRPNILPRAVHNHHLFVNTDGVLESKLLQSAPVAVHLRFSDMRVSLLHTKVCPRIESIESVDGCHSCPLAAKIVLRAKSVCSSGLVSVSFNAIPLSTRAVSLSTDSSLVVIQFVTSLACHKERVCLFYNEIKSCEPVSFCLDAPTLHLTQRNETIAQSTALIHSSGLFDSFTTATQSLGTSIKQYLIWFFAILAGIFTISLLITLLKR